MPKKKTQKKIPSICKRAPVIVVMGHIDHGKSTLLDFIRKSNVVENESGRITQHLSAYQVEHTTGEGNVELLTFLDTPGHSAFQKMRLRGADIADIAILVVSAEDGVKPQTLEALTCIKEAGIPFVVAINKIDKPGANIANTQSSLIEHEIYIEGMGGDIPWTGISALKGDGVDELLDLVVLSTDLLDLKADTSLPASGVVIEGKIDPQRGSTATLIVTNGTLQMGDFVVSGKTYAPVRIMEDYTGTSIRFAQPSTPVGIVGFNDIPTAGAEFQVVKKKKEAESIICNNNDESRSEKDERGLLHNKLPVVPILIKADVLGSIDAIEHEIAKFTSDRIYVKIIGANVGPISKADVQYASATENAIIVGFNVAIDKSAREQAERDLIEIDTFNVIYELSDWINNTLVNKTPKKEEEVITGVVKILKIFSIQKNVYVLGCRVENGKIKSNQKVNITRRDILIGAGNVRNVQQYKKDTIEVEEGEFGMQLETKADIAPGDIINGIDIVIN